MDLKELNEIADRMGVSPSNKSMMILATILKKHAQKLGKEAFTQYLTGIGKKATEIDEKLSEEGMPILDRIALATMLIGLYSDVALKLWDNETRGN